MVSKNASTEQTPTDRTPGSGAARPAVFFDGSCPLCSAEIATYQKCRGADDIDWVDVAMDGTESRSGRGSAGGPDDRTGSPDIVAPGLSRAEAMRRFHMRRADGTIVSGGAAFVELWTALPALSRLGRIGRWPPVALVLEGAYRLFLPARPLLQKLMRTRERRQDTARAGDEKDRTKKP